MINFSQAQKKEFAWLLLGQGVSFIIGVISTKLLTSMGEKNYGLFSLVLSIQGFLSLMLYGPIEQGYLKYYHEYKNDNKEVLYVKILLRYLVAGGLIIVLSSVFVFIPFGKYFQFTTSLILLTCIYLVLTLTNVPLISLANLKRERKYNALMMINERLIYIAAILLLFSVYGASLSNAFLSFVLSLVVIIYFRIKALHVSNLSYTEDEKTIVSITHKKIMIFASPFIVWGMAGWFQSYSERWIINSLLDLSTVGKYALLVMIGNIFITIPFSMISQFLVPIIYEKTADKKNVIKYQDGMSLIKKYFLISVVLVICSTLVVSVAGENIILILSNKNYLENKSLLIFICLGMGMYSLGQVLCTYGLVLNKPQIYLLPKILSGISAVSINYLLVYYYKINGLAISLILVNTIYMFSVAYKNKNLLKDRKFKVTGTLIL